MGGISSIAKSNTPPMPPAHCLMGVVTTISPRRVPDTHAGPLAVVSPQIPRRSHHPSGSVILHTPSAMQVGSGYSRCRGGGFFPVRLLPDWPPNTRERGSVDPLPPTCTPNPTSASGDSPLNMPCLRRSRMRDDVRVGAGASAMGAAGAAAAADILSSPFSFVTPTTPEPFSPCDVTLPSVVPVPPVPPDKLSAGAFAPLFVPALPQYLAPLHSNGTPNTSLLTYSSNPDTRNSSNVGRRWAALRAVLSPLADIRPSRHLVSDSS
mmetsp:Transcript_42311/g.128340  ORF Transcript_42311/g.128340 Transcript_42311/m.128340 type:complete len:265 (-) Transcript_42311:279-1073(-)